ncbi:hypothetical protein ACTFIW_008820 [Dictyostelium discoideum]
MTHNNSASFETPNRSGNYVNRSSLTSPTSPITPIPSNFKPNRYLLKSTT